MAGHGACLKACGTASALAESLDWTYRRSPGTRAMAPKHLGEQGSTGAQEAAAGHGMVEPQIRCRAGRRLGHGLLWVMWPALTTCEAASCGGSADGQLGSSCCQLGSRVSTVSPPFRPLHLVAVDAQFVPATGAAQRANEDGEWPHAERKSGGRRAHVVGRDGEERNDLPPKHVPSNRV